MKYKPSDISKTNEDAIKNPLIEEHNLMGARFMDKKISQLEWDDFQDEYWKRFKSSMHNIIKERIYIEDITNGR